MGGFWPEATDGQKESGWKLSFEFLQLVQGRLRQVDMDTMLQLEEIENCIIAASLVEVDFRKGK